MSSSVPSPQRTPNETIEERLSIHVVGKRKPEEGMAGPFLLWPPLVVILLVAFRAFLEVRIPLSGDEAYYWLWGKHLALGYHDHPPLIGWLIGLSTLFSNQLFWVRLPALICGLLSALFIYLAARDILESRQKASMTLLLFLVMPMLAVSSIAVFTDTPLIFGWALCIWATWKAQNDDRYWLLSGFAIGIALLSKLIGVFLFASLGMFFLVNRESRSFFKNKLFWGGMGVCALVALPVFIWNLNHHFENLFFQAHDHLTNPPASPLFSFLGYVGVQALSASPLIFLLFIPTVVMLVKQSWQGDRASQFLLSFALPIHVTFLLLSFWARVGFHWAVPGYLALLIAMPKLDGWKKWIPWSIGMSLGFTLLFYTALGFPSTVAQRVMALDSRHPQWKIASFLSGKGYGEILGYENLAEEVKTRVDSGKNGNSPFILTDSYTLSSDFAYYLKRQTFTLLLSGQGGQYARWSDYEKLRGKDALWIDFSSMESQPNVGHLLRQAFRSLGPEEKIKIRNGLVTRSFYFVPLYQLQEPKGLHPSIPDVP